VRKKAKNERGTIMSFFKNKKNDSNNCRSRSKSITKRNKKKEQEQQPISISSVHVEKTSLILFDEV
jgi:hypothetical protein